MKTTTLNSYRLRYKTLIFIIISSLPSVGDGEIETAFDVEPITSNQTQPKNIYLQKIDSWLELEKIEFIDSYVLMFNNRWEATIIKIITYKNKDNFIRNRCYVMKKGNHQEKLDVFQLKDLAVTLEQFKTIFQQTKHYSLLEKPFVGFISASTYICQIDLKDEEQINYEFLTNVNPSLPEFKEFSKVGIYYDLTNKFMLSLKP